MESRAEQQHAAAAAEGVRELDGRTGEHLGGRRVIPGGEDSPFDLGSLGVVGRFRKTTLTAAVQLSEPVRVETREGSMDGEPGDWLARGPKGELYPIGREIFAATYEDAGA